MDRKEFLQSSCKYGICSAALIAQSLGITTATAQTATTEDIDAIKGEKAFVEHWLEDLLNTMETVLDRETQLKIVGGCGVGCYNRHQFKQDIAAKGKGNVDKLIEAYKQNYSIERDGDVVHIRYGDTCYCPAAKNRPAKPDDVHCECTRMTHQTIFETALDRPIKVELLESVRRGGKTCHLVVHLT